MSFREVLFPNKNFCVHVLMCKHLFFKKTLAKEPSILKTVIKSSMQFICFSRKLDLVQGISLCSREAVIHIYGTAVHL